MPPTDPVPEADRQEQEIPVSEDVRPPHSRPLEAPEADVIEQEQPLGVGADASGIDAERTEPLADEDRTGT